MSSGYGLSTASYKGPDDSYPKSHSDHLEPGPKVAKLKFPMARATIKPKKRSTRRNTSPEVIRLLGAIRSG